MKDWTQRDPNEAYEDAIAAGVLSTDPSSPRYAELWMYMGTDPKLGDAFKSISFRNYIYVGSEHRARIAGPQIWVLKIASTGRNRGN